MRFDLVYQGIIESDKIFLSFGILSLVLAALVKIFRFSLVTTYFHYPTSYLESALIQMIGISIAILTPARVGEGSKAFLLNKRLGVPLSSSFGIVIFERFFDIFLLGTGAFLFSIYFFKGRIALLIGLFLLGLFILFGVFIRYFNLINRLIPQKYKNGFRDLKLKNNPLLAFSILTTTAIAWIFEAGLPWMLAYSMGVSVPFPLVFGVVCISVIAVVFSILPAGMGTMDLSFLVLFPLLGVSTETALSILLIYRFFGITIPFLFSFVLVNYYGISFRDIKHKIEG
jgi:uncharacterized membrane protein YbhN (UPF0104 family)